MTDRSEIFRASPMLEGFLSTALEDAQLSENDEACSEDREAVDVGTIWNCPDATLQHARTICDAFYAAAPVGESSRSYEELGADLYLECAGHGAGFADRQHDDERDESARIADALSAAVTTRVETYLGDDGAMWFVGGEVSR